MLHYMDGSHPVHLLVDAWVVYLLALGNKSAVTLDVQRAGCELILEISYVGKWAAPQDGALSGWLCPLQCLPDIYVYCCMGLGWR
jgi:hypothetical protein